MFKVVDTTDGRLMSVYSQGVFCVEYKIREWTYAPFSYAPLMGFTHLKDAEAFYVDHNYRCLRLRDKDGNRVLENKPLKLHIYRCKALECIKIKHTSCSQIELMLRLFYGRLFSLYDSIPPKGTIGAMGIKPLERVR